MSNSKLPLIAELHGIPTKDVKHLPGSSGWPFFGHTLQFLNDAQTLMEKLQNKHGDIFYCNLLGAYNISFADPDDVAMILKDKSSNFANSKGWYKMKGLFDGGILVKDFEDHKLHRQTLQKAFNNAAMNKYADGLNTLIKAEIDNWDNKGQFFFSPIIKSLLLDNAASLFLGADLGDESEVLNQAFVDLLGGLLVLKRSERRGSAWQKSQEGKVYLRSWLYARVEERLQSDASDFFTSLCRESQNSDHPMDTDNIVDHTLLLLFAAHDTTTSTISNMMSFLCQYPEWQEKLREEVISIEADTLTMAHIDKLKYCDMVFKETMRLHPPVLFIPRRSIEEIEYKGYRIPKNASINLIVSLLHRSKKYWSNPDQFDPERFSAERNEHRQHRYQYIPFGAGAHTCLGIRFAETQSKIFLFHFLRRYRAIPKKGRSTAMQIVPIPLPKDKLPIRLEKLVS